MKAIASARVRADQLKDQALDWAVEKALGTHWSGNGFFDFKSKPGFTGDYPFQKNAEWRYSSEWAVAGPIIAREGIDLRQLKAAMHETLEMRHFDASKGDTLFRPQGWKRDMVRRPASPHELDRKWLARLSKGTDATVIWGKNDFLSDTPLIAAMRCLVYHRLGAEIDIPQEFL